MSALYDWSLLICYNSSYNNVQYKNWLLCLSHVQELSVHQYHVHRMHVLSVKQQIMQGQSSNSAMEWCHSSGV